MQVWANSRVEQREAVVCPLCRSHWSSSDVAARGLPWAADASLPACHPIPADQQAASRPWVQVYGEHVVACLFSENWATREAALHKINYEFKLQLPQPDALTVTSTVKILERALRDPVLKVFVAALEIVQSLKPEVVPEYSDSMALIFNLVIPNCAVKNKRKR